MSPRYFEQLADLLEASPVLAARDAAIVLEIAFLTIAADGKLEAVEVDAFRQVASSLSARSSCASPVDALLLDLGRERSRDETVERMRAIGAELSVAARETAYRLSVALALADEDAGEGEFEFDFDLQDALELDPHDAERWAEETKRRFDG